MFDSKTILRKEKKYKKKYFLIFVRTMKHVKENQI